MLHWINKNCDVVFFSLISLCHFFSSLGAQLLSKLSKQEQAVHQLTMENAHVTEKLEQVLVEKKVLGERLGLELQTLQEEHTQKLLKIQQNHEHETSLLRETIENIKSAQVLEKDETLREASSWRDTINKTKEQLRKYVILSHVQLNINLNLFIVTVFIAVVVGVDVFFLINALICYSCVCYVTTVKFPS